ncbi:hypothetical protein MAPG_10606 [Magnaporthiopsis poae ATCC 64411]|uniref:Beta-mannosidase B n=1 Tax=Magnaporthiopsis poae (strain ATCC 64411 / 73-15) TaxID=644358 RepID=A0A0C4ED15_MAGP6|nr:hypothetical protein MAPG_10606 [Magnaporthiopsis poae ATCC 64411]
MDPTVTRLLSQGWEVRLSAPSGSDGGEDRWLPAGDLPTEIHLDLFRSGIIPDPHLDFNELAVRWVADRQWTYRCRFDAPPGSGTTDLVLEGLDTFATVSLNGDEILVSENMFVEHRVNVTERLRPRASPSEEAANELVITFDSARKRGLQLVKEHPEHRFIAHQTEIHRVPVRKAQYHWGWDWGPILVTCGPWKPIKLETFATRIEDARISYNLAEDLGAARVTVKVKTCGSSPSSRCRVTLNGETAYSGEPSIADGTQEFEVGFDIEKPQLWWPRGFGKQKMYKVEVSIMSQDEDVLDTVSKTIGLRQAELVREKDEFGESFYFRVNGVDIFCGGSNWIPADSFLVRTTPDRYRDWIVSHVAEGNQAMVRIWGGGIYEHDAFFDVCDEAGVLVWQDFAFACANYPAYPSFLSSVETEARQNVRRLRHHPSLVIWAGNNEDYQIVERYKLKYDFADKDPQSWLKTDFPARYIYEHLLPKILEEEDPGAIYRPSSPWGNGTSTTLVVDPTVGDVHEWNVWHADMKPHQLLPGMGGRFISEFGMEAYPHVPTISRAITDPSQRSRPGTLALDFRNKAINHQRRQLAYLGENVDLHAPTGTATPSSLDGFTYLTQVVQADTMRSAPAWGAASPAVGHRAVSDLWVSNLGTDELEGELQVSLVSIKSGKVLWRLFAQPLGLRIQANGTTEVAARPRRDSRRRSSAANKAVGDKSAAPASTDDDEDSSAFDPAAADPFVIHAQLGIRPVGGGEDRTAAQTVQDVSWPDPLKYIDFSNRGLKVSVGGGPGEGQAGSKTWVKVAAERPVKCFVFQERPGVRLSDNGFDVLPGHPVRVEVDGCHPRELKWTYLGQERQEADWGYTEQLCPPAPTGSASLIESCRIYPSPQPKMPYGKPKQTQASSSAKKRRGKKGQQQHQAAASNQDSVTDRTSIYEAWSKDRPASLEEYVWATATGYCLSQSVVENAQSQIDRVMEKAATLRRTVVETAVAIEEMKKKD